MTALPCPNCAQVPHYKHVEASEEPYRGQWQAIVAWAADRQRSGFLIYPDDLIHTLHRIADERPQAVQSETHRTTRYGREGESE